MTAYPKQLHYKGLVVLEKNMWPKMFLVFPFYNFFCKNNNLTKVRPLFTLSHRGSDNSPLLIVFSANYIDQSIVTFMRLRVGLTKYMYFQILNCRSRGSYQESDWSRPCGDRRRLWWNPNVSNRLIFKKKQIEEKNTIIENC